jgi:hypothetical protein
MEKLATRFRWVGGMAMRLPRGFTPESKRKYPANQNYFTTVCQEALRTPTRQVDSNQGYFSCPKG